MSSKLLKSKILPIVYLHNQLTAHRAKKIIEQIQRVSKCDTAAVALVANLSCQRAVQVDKLVEILNDYRKQKNFPIYGFALSKCSPQSYYLMSNCDKIFASPSTLFTFRRPITQYSFDQLLQKIGIKNIKIRTSQKLMARYLDLYSPPDAVRYLNAKASGIDERLLRYSIVNRSKFNQKVPEYEKMPSYMLGLDAKEKGLIDQYGSIEQILKKQFNGARIMKIEYGNQLHSILDFFMFITSPILVLLFLFKIFLKYSILMYIWFKAKATGKNKLSEVVEQQNIKLQDYEAQWIRQYDEIYSQEQKQAQK